MRLIYVFFFHVGVISDLSGCWDSIEDVVVGAVLREPCGVAVEPVCGFWHLSSSGPE